MPPAPPPAPGAPAWRRLAIGALVWMLRVTQSVSPRPTAALVRWQFARNGRRTGAALAARAPIDVVVAGDEHYDDHRDALLDVYVPASGARPGSPLPTVVWTHGGAFVGGSKDELAGYFRMVADTGFTVAAIRYSLAPREHHPTQVRQLMAALAHLQRHAERLHVDTDRIVLAGDSAGAHLTAQAAALVTNPAYARQVGVAPTIHREQLRGVALFCGVYDLSALDESSPLGPVSSAVLWAYSGVRHARRDAAFTSATRLPDHVTRDFPATFLSVGNADPLRPQSDVLLEALGRQGVPVDALLFPPEHAPALTHEYQFDLALDDARTAFARLVAFLRAHTNGSHR